eukprot:589861-Pleurochrysis_carterae.AAC.1
MDKLMCTQARRVRRGRATRKKTKAGGFWQGCSPDAMQVVCELSGPGSQFARDIRTVGRARSSQMVSARIEMCVVTVLWGVSGKAHKTACDNCERSTGQAPRGA